LFGPEELHTQTATPQAENPRILTGLVTASVGLEKSFKPDKERERERERERDREGAVQAL